MRAASAARAATRSASSAAAPRAWPDARSSARAAQLFSHIQRMNGIPWWHTLAEPKYDVGI